MGEKNTNHQHHGKHRATWTSREGIYVPKVWCAREGEAALAGSCL